MNYVQEVSSKAVDKLGVGPVAKACRVTASRVKKWAAGEEEPPQEALRQMRADLGADAPPLPAEDGPPPATGPALPAAPSDPKAALDIALRVFGLHAVSNVVFGDVADAHVAAVTRWEQGEKVPKGHRTLLLDLGERGDLCERLRRALPPTDSRLEGLEGLQLATVRELAAQVLKDVGPQVAPGAEAAKPAEPAPAAAEPEKPKRRKATPADRLTEVRFWCENERADAAAKLLKQGLPAKETEALRVRWAAFGEVVEKLENGVNAGPLFADAGGDVA